MAERRRGTRRSPDWTRHLPPLGVSCQSVVFGLCEQWSELAKQLRTKHPDRAHERHRGTLPGLLAVANTRAHAGISQQLGTEVLQNLISRRPPVRASERPREPGTRRRQRREVHPLQDPRASDIPGVGHDEASRGVKTVELGSSSVVNGHPCPPRRARGRPGGAEPSSRTDRVCSHNGGLARDEHLPTVGRVREPDGPGVEPPASDRYREGAGRPRRTRTA
jgi:hypothetical protein